MSELNQLQNIQIDLTKILELGKDEPLYKYHMRLERYMIYYKFEKKKKILTFINNWYKLNHTNIYKIEFKDLRQFKNQYYNMMPNNIISKEYLIQNFEIYNREFTLELEYDETLFTTYNVLYFIKLMLQKIDSTLKKEVLNKTQKKYTILLKN